MDINSLKRKEGQKVSVILKNNNVYSHVVYKVTTEGTIEFKDTKTGEECYVLSEFIAFLREEAEWE